MRMRNKCILLLDIGYQPLMFIDRRKALKLEYKCRAELLMGDEVAHLLVSIKWNTSNIHNSRRTFGLRRSIFLRDKNKCQYCNKILTKKDRTLDHIIPKAKGGETSFLNCVASCRKCNTKKGSQNLQKVQMKLLKKPKVPSYFELLMAIDINNIWQRFLKYQQTIYLV